MKSWMMHLSEAQRQQALRFVSECLAAFEGAGSDLLLGSTENTCGAAVREAFEVDGRMRGVQFFHQRQSVHDAETLGLIVAGDTLGNGPFAFRMRQYVRTSEPDQFAVDPARFLHTLAHWRDQLSAGPDQGAVERSGRFMKELTALAQAAAHTQDRPWSRGFFEDDPRSPELGLFLRRDTAPEHLVRYATRERSWRPAGMTRELADAFDDLLSVHDHVTAEPVTEPEQPLQVSVGPAPIVAFQQLRDAMSTLRALSELPPEAALLMPRE